MGIVYDCYQLGYQIMWLSLEKAGEYPRNDRGLRFLAHSSSHLYSLVVPQRRILTFLLRIDNGIRRPPLVVTVSRHGRAVGIRIPK